MDDDRDQMEASGLSGDELLLVLAALASPQRLKIIAELTRGRRHVSRLARDLAMNRPLLHMHLQRLEAAGLVSGALELSDEGKAMKFFEVTPFAVMLSPATIAHAEETQRDDDDDRPADSRSER